MLPSKESRATIRQYEGWSACTWNTSTLPPSRWACDSTEPIDTSGLTRIRPSLLIEERSNTGLVPNPGMNSGASAATVSAVSPTRRALPPGRREEPISGLGG